MKKLAKSFLVCAIVLLMCLNGGFGVQAATVTVATASELAAAIGGASSGDIIEIADNISLTAAITIDKEIVIQSKAGGPFTLKQETADTRHFIVNSDGALTLKNIVLDGNDTGGGVSVYGTAVLEQGAVIKNCRTTSDGGAVRVEGVFTMNGGTISDSTAQMGGGGVYVVSNGKFTMNGGSILRNEAFDGGGVMVNRGTFIMYGGTFSGNHCQNSGGGLSLYYGNETYIYAGTFTDNVADYIGGAIYNDESSQKLVLYNASIEDNEATGYGGGIWLCPTGSAFYYDFAGAIIDNNTAPAGQGQDIQKKNAQSGLATLTLSNTLLGGGTVKWHNETLGTEQTNLENLTGELNLKAVGITPADRETANRLARVIISGNKAGNGGGIATDGPLELGREEPKSVTLTVEKIWAGDEDELEQRPDSIRVYLVMNGTRTNRFITLSEANNWKASFPADEDPAGLTLFYRGANGVIKYSVEEEVPGDYQESYGDLRVNNDGNYEIAITNTRTIVIPGQREVNVIVEKVWKGNAPDGKQPDSIEVYLVVNGVMTDISRILDKNNNWKNEFEGLPYWDDNEDIIAYTVAEKVPKGYKATYSTPILNADGNYEIVITNTSTPVTGDNASPWFILLGASMLGLCGSVFYLRRRKRFDM